MAQAIIQSVVKKTYITSEFPCQNYGASNVLWIGRQNPFCVFRSMLQFDLSSIVGNINVISSKLRIYLDYTPNENIIDDITPYIIIEPWKENTVTWMTQPTFGSSIRGMTTEVRGAGWYEWDVTPIVTAWFNGIYPNYGILMKSKEKLDYQYKRADGNTILVIQYEHIIPGSSILITGRKFTEQKQVVDTVDMDNYTIGYNTSEQSLVSFFVKNNGEYPATVKIQIGFDEENYKDDGPEVEVLPKQTEVFVPKIFGKYTRLVYRSKLPSNDTKLIIVYQAHI